MDYSTQDNGLDDLEADDNLAGFFRLLLNIDKRINPHLYQANLNLNTNMKIYEDFTKKVQ